MRKTTADDVSGLQSAPIVREVTPSDDNDLPDLDNLVGLYVGGAGTLATSTGGLSGDLPGLVAGTFCPHTPDRVLSTGTTATNIRALYKRP